MTATENNESHESHDSQHSHRKSNNKEREPNLLAADKIILGVASFIFISVTGWVGTSLNNLTTKVTELSIIVQHQKETSNEIYTSNKALIDAYTDIRVKVALIEQELHSVSKTNQNVKPN